MKSTYVLFRGYSLLIISMFTILVTVMIANLNPKSEENKKETQAPGDIVVHIVWPNGDIDVDLWLDGPGEPVPVGYSNKGGVLWNLLRDDLGNLPDATPINYEDAFTRGIVPGEYTINVQCFRCNQAALPMTIDVGVSIRDRTPGLTGQLKGLVETKVIIKADGQEKTAVRFIVGPDGTVDKASINNVYKKLRGDKTPPANYSIPPYFMGK